MAKKSTFSKANKANKIKKDSKIAEREPLLRRIFKKNDKNRTRFKKNDGKKKLEYPDELEVNNNFSLLEQEQEDIKRENAVSERSEHQSNTSDSSKPSMNHPGRVDPLETLEKLDLPEEAIKRGAPSILLGLNKLDGKTEKQAPEPKNAVEENADYIGFDWDSEEDESGSSKKEANAAEGNDIPRFMQNNGRFFHEAGKQDESTGRKRKRMAYEIDPSSCPWHRPYKVDTEVSRLLHQDITQFVDYITPTPEEHAVRKSLISRINSAVLKKWPDVSVYVFGSFETRLYLPTSDLDMVIMSSDYHYRGTKKDMYILAHHLRKCKVATEIQVITTANVPIIKFVDPITRIHVDVSFNQAGGLKTCLVVNGFLKKFPALRPLVIIIKHYLNMRALNEVFLGGLSSYAIVCLVASFLQLHPRLSTGSIREEDNYGVLLLELLELYGKRFHYDAVGIAVHNGGFYFSKKKQGWLRPNQPYLLSIMDPVEFTNDVSKSSRGLLRVKATLGNGFDLLTNELFTLASRIEREGARKVSDFPSILGCIISVDEGVRKHRIHMLNCFNEHPVSLEPMVDVEQLSSIDVDNVPTDNVDLQFVEDESDSDEVEQETDELIKKKGLSSSEEVDQNKRLSDAPVTSADSLKDPRVNAKDLFNIDEDSSEGSDKNKDERTYDLQRSDEEESRATKVRKKTR
ncbi:poly(A) polymerase Cid14 [Schizosaccharomyces cryophilus OY26]|uniref:polynucleotide adenylyltransferase n=1 Tax=Schizosaccharomyces cryophilus (strain OY26 / ATCC MYA-4695 / CBS 11777 / NBRC 106824 / NRRL Y48691) TaxID=653667 RepID=S9XG60_SCHCR|nr:poly(A) polymerase Cid14 [Schizosaccharomyces cryophilus OY26]EPY52646.1 poly(A) polymerase Cid14 [Schizosaccharomyces cryophilus OY26]